MPRIRSVKPEFWTSERLGTLLPGVDGRQARLLFIALWNLAEDHGVCRGSPVYLRGAAFIYDEDVTAKDVERWLSMLEAGRFIVRYQDNGSSLIWIRGFDEHQKIDRKSKTSLREPSREEKDGCASPRRVLDEPSLQEGKGREGKGEERNLPASQSAPPEASPQASGEELPDVTHHAEEVPNAVAAFVAQAPLLPEAVATPPEKPAPKGPDPEALRALWNRLAPPKGLARWEAMNKARTAAAKASLLEVPDLGKWEAWLTHELDRPFNRGDNPSGWRADVDWLLRAKTRGLVVDFDPATARPTPAAAETKPTKFLVL